jgi:hypothetical protein
VVDIRRMSEQPETRGRGNILYPRSSKSCETRKQPQQDMRSNHRPSAPGLTHTIPRGSGISAAALDAIGFGRTVFSHGFVGRSG